MQMFYEVPDGAFYRFVLESAITFLRLGFQIFSGERASFGVYWAFLCSALENIFYSIDVCNFFLFYD